MIGALVLIAAGTLLLLTNLGLVTSGVWLGMLSLWPVVLIAVGIGLLLPREAQVSRASVAGVAIVVMTVGGSLLAGQDLSGTGRTSEVEVPMEGAEQASIEVEVGAGRLRVTGGAAEGQAVTGQVGLSRGQRLIAEGAQKDGVTRVRIAAEGRWFRLGVNPNRVPPWQLRVTDAVPVQLRLSSGVGEAEMDLRGLSVDEARVDVGLGRSVIVLPDRGRPRIRIDGGIGEITVRVPDTLPARLAIETGIGTTNVEGDFRQEGDIYTTEGWEDASERLDVTIQVSVGTVRVERD